MRDLPPASARQPRLRRFGLPTWTTSSRFEVQGLLEQIGCSPSRERQSASARQDPCSAGVRTKLSRTVMIASLHPYIRLQERDGWDGHRHSWTRLRLRPLTAIGRCLRIRYLLEYDAVRSQGRRYKPRHRQPRTAVSDLQARAVSACFSRTWFRWDCAISRTPRQSAPVLIDRPARTRT